MNLTQIILLCTIILICLYGIKYEEHKIEQFSYDKYNDGQNVIFNYEPTTTYIENFDATIKEKCKPTPRIIWAYWENINRDTIPTHIQLCFDTFRKHLAPKYKVNILTDKTIKKFLPDVREDLNDLLIAQKTDYYRVALLYKYGGIWIDADTIVMKNLDEIFEKLDNCYDYVGFGCTGVTCTNGQGKPSNGVMASRPNGILMKKCLEKLNHKIDNKKKGYGYFDLGKIVIWESLADLSNSNYKYYHFPSEYDGTRSNTGHWIHTPHHFRTTPTKLLNENKVLFMMLANATITKNQKWAFDCSKRELLNKNLWISKLFRKSLEIY